MIRFLVLATALVAAAPAPAQVLKELGPAHLEYAIHFREEAEPVGFATASFATVDTPAGQRLRITVHTEYTLPLTAPWDYAEEVEMLCSEEGVVSWHATSVNAGDTTRIHAELAGEDYRVRTIKGGQTLDKTITSGVRRTNLGHFCAGYLAEPLDQGALLRDYPLLFPAAGDHEPRQKYRDGVYPYLEVEGEVVRAISSRLKRLSEDTDRFLNSADEMQILLRKELNTGHGLLTYVLQEYNGVSYRRSP